MKLSSMPESARPSTYTTSFRVKLTNCSDPILFYQADEADSHTTPLLHDASVNAFGVLAGLLVDDVGEQPGESA